MAGIASGQGGPRVDLIGVGNPVLSSGRSKGERLDAYFDQTSFLEIDWAPSAGIPWRDRFGEAGVGQLRFEAFNLFNRTNFGLPNRGITTVASES